MRSKFFLLFGLCLCACDPCRNLDCAVSNDTGLFRIVDKTSGNDLLFGAQKKYEPAALKFYALSGADTIVFQSRVEPYYGDEADSILQVRFHTHPSQVFIDFGNGDIDTLQMTFENVDSRCCGTLTNFTQLRYNNTQDLPMTGIQEIKK